MDRGGYTPRRDWFARRIAWRLPRRVVMWAVYRVLAHATTGRYEKDTNVATLTAFEALNRWDGRNDRRQRA